MIQLHSTRFAPLSLTARIGSAVVIPTTAGAPRLLRGYCQPSQSAHIGRWINSIRPALLAALRQRSRHAGPNYGATQEKPTRVLVGGARLPLFARDALINASKR